MARSFSDEPYPENPFDPPYSDGDGDDYAAIEEDRETRRWAMILHLSHFAGYVVPLAGFLAPLIIWLVKKDDLPGIDAHGREVTNWVITEFIYFTVSVILCMFLIGIPLIILLSFVSVIFPIIGAVKAADGKFFRYPMNIRLL